METVKRSLIRCLRPATGLIFSILSLSAFAVDSASLEIGGENEVRLARIGLQWDWSKRWLASNGNHLGGYWDLTLGQWHGKKYKNDPDRTQDIAVIGITPVFRYQRDNKTGPYFEVGIGANLLSELYDNNGDRLSTAFQFGDHVGLGYVFNNKLDIGVKYQHYSNGGIKNPNSGVNFAILKASYRF